ncbi:unnamed protein product [Acanthoscelides obtectus]|uniref:Uncharacterized protein n=1 Tax=Acanthoscelides obtectus TaxID=200917 RepID=A0A9P0PAL0_ACAOB|nr:unnamed protein product [Acanthoscelides obtectus]CAK1640893.1 hypothetical protein AOBTE_LOCUS12003 [Acanthoscelides obtectus]
MASWSRSEIGAVLRPVFRRNELALKNDCPHRSTIFRW